MKRQSNIELLRIFAILGVVYLHYYNGQMGGASALVEHNSINFFVLNFVESATICAVNVFVLICGYFLSQTYTRNLIKPIQLAVQVVVINVGFFLLGLVLSKDFSITGLLRCLVPSNWFVILYVVLFVISPYINIVIDALSTKKLRTLILLCLFVFSIVPTAFDFVSEAFNVNFQMSPIGMYGNQEGYTIVNFVLMYLIGAYLARCDMEKIKLKCIAPLTLVNIGVIFALLYKYKIVALEYCSPFVIGEAVLYFVLFSKMQINFNGFINALAKGTFSVFLLHFYFLGYINLGYFVNQNPLILVAHILISLCAIFLSCWGLGFVYDKVTTPVYKYICGKFPRLVWNIKAKDKTG